MKKKMYKHGTMTYKAYMKPAGKGYEVGLACGTKHLFMGNFLHSKEANAWYTQMNNEITKFSKKYWITSKAPKTFYTKFLTNHLYKAYYTFLEKAFTKYNRTFKTEFNKDERKYQQLKKNWKSTEKVGLRRKAA